MKIRTVEHLSDALSVDLIWRKKELSSLRFALEGSTAGTSEHSALLRGSLALLYAHWEGFIKGAGSAYLEYLAAQRLRYNELSPNFLALAARKRLHSASLSNQIEAHIELTKFFRTQLGEPSSIPYRDGIRTRSNLSSHVLRDITATLGLDYALFATKAVMIDERLVEGRNGVAHGEFIRVEQDDYVLLQDEIIGLLNLFRNLVENAVVLKSYLAT